MTNRSFLWYVVGVVVGSASQFAFPELSGAWRVLSPLAIGLFVCLAGSVIESLFMREGSG